MEVRDNFDAATSALKERFDGATIHNSLHLQLHSLKQGPTESVTDFCFALERKFIRLNVTAEFNKLLVFMDGVLPHIRFEIHKCSPQTCAEAKTMALMSQSIPTGYIPPGNPRENFFERANSGHPGNFFV